MAIRVAVPFQVMVVIAKGEHDMMTKRKGDTCSASDVTVAVKVMMASRQKSMQRVMIAAILTRQSWQNDQK